MYLFLSSAAGTDAAAGGGSMIIMMVVLIAVFYFLMIRPENKRKKEAEAMRNALKVGDNITTIGGIIGDIVSVKDDSIVIETSSDRVRVEFAKFAVSTNNTAEKEAAKKRTAAAEARKQAKADKKKK
jgi:preprotein translocase subunit YajC